MPCFRASRKAPASAGGVAVIAVSRSAPGSLLLLPSAARWSTFSKRWGKARLSRRGRRRANADVVEERGGSWCRKAAPETSLARGTPRCGPAPPLSPLGHAGRRQGASSRPAAAALRSGPELLRILRRQTDRWVPIMADWCSPVRRRKGSRSCGRLLLLFVPIVRPEEAGQHHVRGIAKVAVMAAQGGLLLPVGEGSAAVNPASLGPSTTWEKGVMPPQFQVLPRVPGGISVAQCLPGEAGGPPGMQSS